MPLSVWIRTSRLFGMCTLNMVPQQWMQADRVRGLLGVGAALLFIAVHQEGCAHGR